MKKYYLIIFFISCLFSYFVYNKFNNEKESILLYGDINILNKEFNDNYNINTFFYNKINLKGLKQAIKINDKKIIKDENVYLNQLIYSSNCIFIGVNIIKNFDSLNNLINDIYKIHNDINIIIVSNMCEKANNNNNYKCISIDEYKNNNFSSILEM